MNRAADRIALRRSAPNPCRARTWRRPDGGYFFWLQLAAELNAGALRQKAEKQRLAMEKKELQRASKEEANRSKPDKKKKSPDEIRKAKERAAEKKARKLAQK